MKAKTARSPSVAIIGAGWAGCAAGVELSRLGAKVTVYEAARVPGGRARRVEHQAQLLDNGQHILLGAYRDTLKLMQAVGLHPEQCLLRLPLQMRYPQGVDGMDFIAARLPAPLHLLVALLRAQGLAFADKLALARFSSAARWMGWQLHVDCSVSELLERFDQTDRLNRLLWHPLCIAALNTPPERASAKVFLNVLRDSLGAARSASDMLLPRLDLTALFPEAALAHIAKQGAELHLGVQVRSVSPSAGRWMIHSDQANQEVDAVILANSPAGAQHLVQAIDAKLAESLQFDYEPITTCYLQYPAALRLPLPFYALADDVSKAHWAQFVFDRGQLDTAQAGLLAMVISASSQAQALSHEQLVQDLSSQLAAALNMKELAQPLWSKLITEKRATFACVPNLERPECDTGHTGLWLAGDYTQGDYPATIEGAVRSGLQAAGLLMQSLRS